MPFNVDVTVTEVRADLDPLGGEYTFVSFAYRVPVPAPPSAVTLAGPQPKQIAYKHALHLIIPREKWLGQYNMWEQYALVVKDDGVVELKRVEAKN